MKRKNTAKLAALVLVCAVMATACGSNSVSNDAPISNEELVIANSDNTNSQLEIDNPQATSDPTPEPEKEESNSELGIPENSENSYENQGSLGMSELEKAEPSPKPTPAVETAVSPEKEDSKEETPIGNSQLEIANSEDAEPSKGEETPIDNSKLENANSEKPEPTPEPTKEPEPAPEKTEAPQNEESGSELRIPHSELEKAEPTPEPTPEPVETPEPTPEPAPEECKHEKTATGSEMKRNDLGGGCYEDVGVYSTQCTLCNKRIDTEERVLGVHHETIVIQEGKAPTCTEDGMTDVETCGCGAKGTAGGDTLHAYGHSITTWYTGEVSEDGMKARKVTGCVACDYVESEEWEQWKEAKLLSNW